MNVHATAFLLSTALVAGIPQLHCEGGGVPNPGTGGSGGGTTCTPLVVADPAVSLAGYTQFTPEQKQNNPNAGEPWYVYLAAGSEAVVLKGPNVPATMGLFALQQPSIAVVGQRETSADGYLVTVNPRLRYAVAIDDFESEVSLARVELCETNANIESRFIFRGNPGASGVAHAATISATADNTNIAPTPPFTIEVR